MFRAQPAQLSVPTTLQKMQRLRFGVRAVYGSRPCSASTCHGQENPTVQHLAQDISVEQLTPGRALLFSVESRLSISRCASCFLGSPGLAVALYGDPHGTL